MKQLLSLMLLIFITSSSFGKMGIQLKQKKFLPNYYGGDGGYDPDRLQFGGNLGMNFAQDNYSAFISPSIGYSFGRFILGFNAGYNFYYQKLPYRNALNGFEENYIFTSSNYSISLYTRLALLGPLFVHVEPGYEFYKVFDTPAFTYETTTGKAIEHTKRVSIPIVLVGAGFQFPIGERVSFIIYGLYDVIQNKDSPYYKLPIIRGGFFLGNW